MKTYKISSLKDLFIEEYNSLNLEQENNLLFKWVEALLGILIELTDPDTPCLLTRNYEDGIEILQVTLLANKQNHIQTKGIAVDETSVAEIRDNDTVTKDELQQDKKIVTPAMEWEEDANGPPKTFTSVGTQTTCGLPSQESKETQTNHVFKTTLCVTTSKEVKNHELIEGTVPLISNNLLDPPSNIKRIDVQPHHDSTILNIASPQTHSSCCCCKSKTRCVYSNKDDDSSVSNDSDIPVKKPPIISKAQHLAWKKKKKLVYKHGLNKSSIETKIKRKDSKYRIQKREIIQNDRQEDRPLWIVAKVTNFNTQFSEACMLQIVKVLDKPPCVVSKKTIGVLVVTKLSLVPS